MPADGRAGSIFVDQRHRKRFGVDTSPLRDRRAQGHQKHWQGRRRHPAVRLAKERDTPACRDAAHFEGRECDVGNGREQVPLIRLRDEVVAIVKAWGQIILEEAWRPGHEPVSHALDGSAPNSIRLIRRRGPIRSVPLITASAGRMLGGRCIALDRSSREVRIAAILRTGNHDPDFVGHLAAIPDFHGSHMMLCTPEVFDATRDPRAIRIGQIQLVPPYEVATRPLDAENQARPQP